MLYVIDPSVPRSVFGDTNTNNAKREGLFGEGVNIRLRRNWVNRGIANKMMAEY